MCVYFHILDIIEEAGPDHARRGAGTSIFGACRFRKKTFIFLAYSIVLASGIARRDPPRRVDAVIHVAPCRDSYGLGKGLTSSGPVDLYRLRRPYDGRVMMI